MVSLDVTETSKALAVTGGYILMFGLVSYFLKERLFISEALLALVAGIIFGPLAADIFSPQRWVGGTSTSLTTLTFEVTRIVIAIQVLFTGIALPKAYLWRERLSLFTLLIPVMTAAWFVTGLLVWALIPGLTFLEALVIGSCVTPTDPVLANSICKEKHVPLHVRNIIVAESAANDGLGYPFLYIGLYLILIHEASHPYHTVGGAIGEWFYNIVLYQIVLSCILGGIIGYVARKVLKFAEKRKLIDHESFLAFGVALTFFTLGVVGILGSDDLLACFIVGNSFTWDDWFRLETEDHAFQDVIDNLLNTAIFLYIGAIMPWNEFGNFWGITPWRLVVLGILVMLVRRLPWVLTVSKFIPALPTWREAAFAGFFGPIGVGAVFYNQVALEVLPDDGTRERLRNVITPVVFFLVLTSVIVHGSTIPLAKGFQNARSLTLTRSSGTAATLVSRLPPPVPVGTVNPDESGSAEPKPGAVGAANGTQQAPRQPGGNVAFDLRNDGTPDAWPGGAPRQAASAPASRPASAGSARRDSARGQDMAERGDAGNGGDAGEDSRPSVWREGHEMVYESKDGETTRVVHD